ncbi:hypothetical protein DLJ53_28985 [Acuticoccus sediminis]|uniref:Outer membrane protein beta-barrel domain-containing protein n=1 Tax=Acuticoccus sediminis TaxID=2184697 RepID=A0A8B2NLW9_9HYPH|nr:hypothetical protein [Acuticoccus sediminis]RAH97246.1 hypothetical protein DLJ53_28985 [Acuticoccus sediminis]
MRSLIAACFAAATLTTSIAAHAADLGLAAPIPQEEFEKRWSVTAGVYLWGAGLDGKVGVGGYGPADVNLSFGDILEDLDIAVMAASEIRYDRFGLFTDLFYTKTSSSASVLDGYVDVSVGTSIFAGTAMAEYRVLQQDQSSLDVMAGARVWSVKADLDLRAVDGRTFDLKDTETWVDPMIGAKGRLKGSWPMYLTGWGMIGGFGVGSDIDWDVLAAVGYEFNKHVSLLAGYRAVGVDYSDDGYEFDTILHGPVVSGVLRF